MPDSLQLNSAWVQGVNMYMGKTALMIDSVVNQGEQVDYLASLFLGACSEPKMKWQLVVQGQDKAGQTHSFFFNFMTVR